MWTTILPDEMKTLEQRFMEEYRVPSALLMEHAAMAVCDALRRHVPQSARVLFLCGPGNNGGDGWAAARIWRTRGGKATVIPLTDWYSGDSAMNRTLAQQLGIPVLPAATDPLPECDAICDALFGTGLSRKIEEDAARLIRLTNAAGVPVVAVDIPSGLDGAQGIPLGETIRAAETVTFHRPKQGLVLGSSPDYTGTLTVAPILIPHDFGDTDGLKVLLPEDLPGLLPPRPATAHKGSCGRTVILAGSPGMAGAAALCARAAIRAGSGLTTLLCRESILPILQVLVPAATCIPLPEQEGHLLPEAAKLCRKALRSAQAAAVGPGLGTDESLLPLLRAFREAECPVVWDADALNMLSAWSTLLPLKPEDMATPHPGEAARLLDISTAEITEQPLKSLRRLQKRLGCTVLLKGARSLMTDGTRTAANIHGSPAMAKGGSGDVLTGLTAGLAAQRMMPDSLTLLQTAVLLHSLAGEKGSRGTDPQELCDRIEL